MASRSLNDLHPITRAKAKKFLDIASTHHIDVLIYCTYRSAKEQEVLYMQGRLKRYNVELDELNRRRMVLGLYKLSTKEANRVVTYAKPWQSFHQYGLAFDCVPMHGGRPAWDDKDAYAELGKIAVAVGLEWAGGWKHFRETPHFQDTETYNHIKRKE